MSKYIVDGSVKMRFEMEIEAVTEAEAKKKAKSMLDDMYHFDATGAYHNPKSDVTYEIDAEKIESD